MRSWGCAVVACAACSASPSDAAPDPVDVAVDSAASEVTAIDTSVPDVENETVGGDSGPAFKTPIRYVFVIVKENHTFENYFTDFPGATDGPKTIDRAGTAGNITRTPTPDYDKDIGHSNDDGVLAFNGGKMNGFEPFAYHYYTEKQIPGYWTLARRFVLADHFFSTVMGPTAPGHFAVWTAQAPFHGNARAPDPTTPEHKCGQTDNGTRIAAHFPGKCRVEPVFPCFDVPILPDVIKKPLTWRRYGPNGGGPFVMIKSYGGVVSGPNFRNHIDDLFTDLDAGDLANVTIVNVNNGQYKGRNVSEHPPQNPCHGENWTIEVVRRLMDGPHWKETAILLTYDDWGGWYDSVPPAVEKCDDGASYPGGEFFHTGFRLPLIVVSPYARAGFVLKTPAEHASIPRLIEDLFELPRMASLPNGKRARDDTAGSLLGAFDFTQAPRPPLTAAELSPRTCP